MESESVVFFVPSRSTKHSALGASGARIDRTSRSPSNTSMVFAWRRATATTSGAFGSKHTPVQPGTATESEGSGAGFRNHCVGLCSATPSRRVSVTTQRPEASADASRVGSSPFATTSDEPWYVRGSYRAMDWISWRWRTARTRVVTPSSTVAGLSIASLPSATSSPPAKGTACRQTPPPDATNATHVDASGSVCTATREDATEPGLGCTRVPSFATYGSSTSDRTRDVTRMESLPSPKNLWRFDPMAAMIANRREARRPPLRVTRRSDGRVSLRGRRRSRHASSHSGNPRVPEWRRSRRTAPRSDGDDEKREVLRRL